MDEPGRESQLRMSGASLFGSKHAGSRSTNYDGINSPWIFSNYDTEITLINHGRSFLFECRWSGGEMPTDLPCPSRYYANKIQTASHSASNPIGIPNKQSSQKIHNVQGKRSLLPGATLHAADQLAHFGPVRDQPALDPIPAAESLRRSLVHVDVLGERLCSHAGGEPTEMQVPAVRGLLLQDDE